MNNLLFVWGGATPLAAELSKPIKRVSVEFVIPNVGPNSVALWRSDGTGLRLRTEMHDVAVKREVGVLNFEDVSALLPRETLLDVALFQDPIVVSKLLIHESGTIAESGVVLKASSGCEIVIVAGACPYSLAVLGVASMPHLFEPEYPIDLYTRAPFA
jgi:hypothetical protein